MVVNKGAFILNVDFWFSESVLSFKCKTKVIDYTPVYKLNWKLKNAFSNVWFWKVIIKDLFQQLQL